MRNRKARQNQYNKSELFQEVMPIFFVGKDMDKIEDYEARLKLCTLLSHQEREVA